jgi:hypothetical protein
MRVYNIWEKESKMRRFYKLLGIVAIVAAIGLVGCSNGDDDGGGGEYPYAEYFPKKTVSPGVSERPHIKIYFNKKIVNSYLSQSDTAFSITVGGSSQSFAYNIELVPPLFDTVGIWFNNDLPTGGIIKVSYDGTGVLAGKLETFSDLAVSRK